MVFLIRAVILFALTVFMIPKFAIQLFSQTPIIVDKAVNYLRFAKFILVFLLHV